MKKITHQSRLKIRWLHTKALVLLLFVVFLSIFQAQAQTFSYTGSVQTVTLSAGSYEIETWGGDGGNNMAPNTGGKGGYSKGILNVASTTTYYIYVGGKGITGIGGQPSAAGGYNGGGTAAAYATTSYGMGSGGGATHVATVSGLLSTLSGNQSAVVIVAGGAGGAGSNNGAANLINNGGHGGGLTGGNGFSGSYGGTGGSQTAGGTGSIQNGSFGQGGNNSGSNTGAGGGGGWYGGGAAQWEGSGGGSSYTGGIATGMTIMFGQTGFMPNPDTTGNGTVVITSMAPCTGTPTTGVVSITSRTCSSQPFTLSASGATRAGGITYQWQRSNAGANNFSDINGATSAFYTVTNQTVASDYRFIVTCTNTNGTTTSNVVSMAQTVATGFYENFDSTATGTSSNASPPVCWTYLDSHTGYGYTSTSAGRAVNGFYVYMPVSTGDLKLISPTTDNLGNGTKQVRFWAKVSSTTYQTTQKLGVYTMNGTTGTATKTLVEDNIPLTTTWQEFIVPLPMTTDDYFAFSFDSQNGTAYVYLDDVYYEDLSPCAFPVGLKTSAITHNSVDLSWAASTAPGVTGYYYEVRNAAGTVVDSGTVSGTTVKSTGLIPGTDYTVFIRSVCGATNGNWTTFPIKFTTLCVAVTANFYEDFNSTAQGSSGSASPPVCWTYLDSHTGYGYTSSTAGQTGNGFYVYVPVATGNLMLISPETVNLGNGTKQIRFSAKVNSTSYIPYQKLEIYSMNGTTGTATKTLLQTTLPLTTTWQEFIVPLPVTTDDYFAFSFNTQNGTSYIYLDDVYYEDLSPCGAPGNIGAINITATGATINWNKSLATGVTGYDYEVRDMNGAVVKSGTVTSGNTVSAAVTGLTPGTYYQVYVRSKCGASNGSWTTNPLKFATLCAVLTGNFFEGFENTPGGGSTNASQPLCWSYIDTNTGYAYTSTTAALAPSTQGFYVYRTTATGDLMLVSPETTNLGGGNKRIRFSAMVNSTTYIPYQKLEIYRMNGNTGAATKTLVQGNFPLTAGWQEFIVYLPNTTDDYFAFSFGAVTGSSYTYIDNIYYEDIPPLLVDVVKTDILCNGANSGSAVATPTGGKPPYTYAWAPSGATTASVSNLVPGSHTVTVTDDRGTKISSSVTITEPTLILPNLSFTNISCNGKNDGSASVAPSGGIAPYTVLWSDGKVGPTNTKMTPGSYSVTVRDANSCPVVHNFTINEPSVLTSSVTSQSNVTVYGGNDGSATITVTGGTAPYSYSWSPSGGTAASASNLSAGTYNVLVTDSKGCTTTQSVVITQPVIPYDIHLVSQTNVSCNGLNDGSITINVTGGTAPYSYSWSQSGGNSPAISNLASGTYVLTVTDAESNVVTKSYTITEPAVLAATIGSVVNVNCSGNNNGSATVVPTGGTAPYTYLWSNGMTTVTATNLTAANFSVAVTDANGCKTTASVSISQPVDLVLTNANTTNVSCYGQNDGSATVSVSGGAAPYTYLWNNGQTGTTISSLSKGTYSVTVTDANNCSKTQSFIITEPTFVHPPVAVNQSFCTGQNAKLSDIVITGSTIKWYSAAVGGTLLPSTTVLVNATTYYASQTVGVCESSSRTAVQITLGQGSPLITSQLNVCSNTRIQNMNIDGFNYTQLKWYDSATSTVPLPVSQLLATGTYYVSSVTGTCESARKAIQTTVAAAVAAPTALSQTACSSTTLNDLTVGKDPGATLRWYTSFQALTPLANTTVVSTGTYYVQQVIGSCESVRIPVQVEVVNATAPSMTSIVTCQGNTIADLNNSGTSKYVWYVNNTTSTALPDTFVITSGTYYIANDVSGCISSRTNVAVTVNSRPTSPTGATSQMFGFAAKVSDLVMNQPNVSWFASYNDAVVQVNELSKNASLQNGLTYYGILTGTNNCGSLPTAVTVTLNLSNAELDLTQLKYYPNPVDTELNIIYIEEIKKVEIFTITGQKVFTNDFQSQEVKVDLSRLSSGTYLVRIETDKASQFVKVIKK